MFYRKTLTAVFCIVLCNLQYAKAQLYSDDMYWTDSWLRKEKLTAAFGTKGYVLIKGSLMYNSTAVTNDFINQQLYNQHSVSEADAKFSVNRLKSHNMAGLDGHISITGAASVTSSLMIDAGVSYRDFSSLYFTRDLFKLIFENYEQYNNKDARIGPTNMREYNYAAVFLGAQKVLSDHMIVGTRLSLIKGGYYQEVNIGDGVIHYSADFLNPHAEINAPFQYYSQERKVNPFASDNGWGGGIDLYSSVNVGKAVFSAEVRDLGFINWKNMDAYIGDKTYSYDGADLASFFIPNNIDDPTPDEIAKEMGIPKQKVNKQTWLPTKIHLAYLQQFNKNIALKADANYMFLPGYKPYAKLAVFFSAGSAFFIAPAVVVGGFGKINSQLGIGATLADTWTLQINAMALEYLTARKTTSGHGAELVLAKSFK